MSKQTVQSDNGILQGLLIAIALIMVFWFSILLGLFKTVITPATDEQLVAQLNTGDCVGGIDEDLAQSLPINYKIDCAKYNCRVCKIK